MLLITPGAQCIAMLQHVFTAYMAEALQIPSCLQPYKPGNTIVIVAYGPLASCILNAGSGVQIGHELLAAAGQANLGTTVSAAERRTWFGNAARMFFNSPDGTATAAR